MKNIPLALVPIMVSLFYAASMAVAMQILAAVAAYRIEPSITFWCSMVVMVVIYVLMAMTEVNEKYDHEE